MENFKRQAENSIAEIKQMYEKQRDGFNLKKQQQIQNDKNIENQNNQRLYNQTDMEFYQKEMT